MARSCYSAHKCSVFYVLLMTCLHRCCEVTLLLPGKVPCFEMLAPVFFFLPTFYHFLVFYFLKSSFRLAAQWRGGHREFSLRSPTPGTSPPTLHTPARVRSPCCHRTGTAQRPWAAAGHSRGFGQMHDALCVLSQPETPAVLCLVIPPSPRRPQAAAGPSLALWFACSRVSCSWSLQHVVFADGLVSR